MNCCNLNNSLLIMGTGCSGIPLAKAHWKTAADLELPFLSSLGHYAIAFIEAIPLLGGLIALVECIFLHIQRTCFAPSPLSKLLKNAEKAVKEATFSPRMICSNPFSSQKDTTDAYALPDEAIPSPAELEHRTLPNRPLTMTTSESSDQGIRDTMEDAHFFHSFDKGFLLGVFDGHGGPKTAEEANRLFPIEFPVFLAASEGDVRKAFTETIQKIQNSVKTRFNDGCTAVVCFVDKQTHLIYTATLGDSEANIYRAIRDDLRSIPLSCVRDWSSRKDQKRARAAGGMLSQEEEKVRYAIQTKCGIASINVSRALGDHLFFPAISQKAKITVNKLKKGDILVLACDGLKDFASEAMIIAALKRNSSAANLVNTALVAGRSQDNVTVMVSHIGEE